jgi:hypothetical protein
MSNPRTPIDELQLQGSPNLRRAFARQDAEMNAPPLSPETKSEIEEIDALIAQALKCCKRGATFRKKSNPAFRQLESLIRSREVLLKGHTPRKKSAADVLADADRILGIN